jgi:hypothetical protein
LPRIFSKLLGHAAASIALDTGSHVTSALPETAAPIAGLVFAEG